MSYLKKNDVYLAQLFPISYIKMFILLHKVVRNDEPCPTCRRYYISCHETKDDAYKLASERIDEKKDLLELKKDGFVWIDEWVRRGNGDVFRVFPTILNHTYVLSEPIITDPSEPNQICKYMLLKITIDKHEWCPENTIYHISFHDTVQDAFTLSITYCKSLLHFEEDLIAHKPIWIQGEKPDKGTHFEIISLEPGKEYYLNSHCSRLSSVFHSIK